MEGPLRPFRSRTSKCTIGSAPNSTLRLLAPGVQPCQCLILRGEHGTIVRSWSSNTRLNGRQFTDGPLARSAIA